VSPARRRTRKKKEPKRDVARDDERSASGLTKWTGVILLVLLAVTAVIVFFVYPASPGPGLGMAVEVDVEDTDASKLAEALKAAGVVSNPRWFAWYLRLTGGTGSVIRGKHYLTDDLTPRELLHRLERRGGAHSKVVVPEGWTRFDIAKRLDALHVCTTRGFLDATEDPLFLTSLHVPFDPARPSAEGFLFPATYDLELDSDPRAVVRQMVKQFDKRYAALEARHDSGIKDLEDSLHWGRREIVILASMIEREAAVDDERPVIASVFLNRLRDPSFTPKRLQCDPTAGYGCLVGTSEACVGYHGRVTPEINRDPDNLYSTYTHDGLPPGPIDSPGARSIEAVMSPALTHYFYFVAKGGGRHTFSETLGAHNAAVHGDAGR
jgi:UPF0755 protein